MSAGVWPPAAIQQALAVAAAQAVNGQNGVPGAMSGVHLPGVVGVNNGTTGLTNSVAAAAVAVQQTMHHQMHNHHSSTYAESDGGDSHDDESSSKDDGSLKGGGSGSVELNGGGTGSDAEGVWSPDIEQSFQEALAIYPPCGRRKIILSDEGKMYGRNELIARYIKLRTGKTRTRKQVSSHIQVLARRKQREIVTKSKDHKDSNGIVSAKTLHSQLASVQKNTFDNRLDGFATAAQAFPSSQFWPDKSSNAAAAATQNFNFVYPFFKATNGTSNGAAMPMSSSFSMFEGRSIATPKFRLIEFSAYMQMDDNNEKHQFVHIGPSITPYADPELESVDIRQIYDKFPEKKGLKELYDKGPQEAFFLVKFWADLSSSLPEDSGAFYGVTSQYESTENIVINCSTKVCSFGKQVVEKVEKEYPRFEDRRIMYRINRSEMCEYMINFIHKLKNLPEKYMMNSVLENFTILQVITNVETQETLLCTAFVFEVSEGTGTQHHIYRLTKD